MDNDCAQAKPLPKKSQKSKRATEAYLELNIGFMLINSAVHVDITLTACHHSDHSVSSLLFNAGALEVFSN